MFFQGRDTRVRSSPPIVIDGRVADAARDAEPIDLWDAWLFAEAEASLTLQDWSSAADEDKAAAYAGYRAALEREEQAARVLADRVRDAGVRHQATLERVRS
jgi:hypothetical protein